MEMKATDLSAKLLANENLTVVRGNVQTASFDIKSRVLTLPMWKDMTPEIEDMLVGHEVGHALYTLDKYIDPIKENPKLHGYMNILEDVRIEKLIKRTYPGLRKRMNEGYKQLNDRDFFGVEKTPMESLLLIDRINLYFKAGFQCGVKFDADEKPFVNRAERTETVEEVIELAKELYAFAKEKAEQQKKQRQQAGVPGDDEDDEPEANDMDDLDLDNDWDADGEDVEKEDKQVGTKKTSGSSPDKDEEDNIDPATDRAFQQKLEELADNDTVYRYHKLDGKLPYDVVIPFKQVLQDLDFNFENVHVGDYWKARVYNDASDQAESKFNEKQKQEYLKFKTDTTSSVNYLVKEFEMKKSAQLYKRAQESKSGSLDMRKIYAYQIQDDLFKRVTTIPKGKNHGMIMLIDWSGSMSDVIGDTIKQVINLTMFCNKAQIPYRVFAFTSQYDKMSDDYIQGNRAHMDKMRTIMSQDQQGGTVFSNRFNLLELFSNRMTMSEFNGMVRRMLDPRVFWHRGYDLGGTPLNEALLWVYNNIGDYAKANRIEKMNLITLSDGAGGPLQSTLSFSRYNRSYINGKHCKVHDFVRDDATKKNYKFGYDANQQTETILKMIKDRYDVRVVGFYICANRRRTLECAIADNVHGFNGDVGLTIDAMRKDFRDNGFYSLGGTGRDDLFIVPAEKTKIDEGELVVESDMSARRLATSLGKFLNTKKTSRVLLSRFIGYIA
jgi:hypothetical protein